MAAQVVLNNQESTYGSPYGYYTVTLTPSGRTKDSVTIRCDVSAHLQLAGSHTVYGVTCGLYIGGAWHDFTLIPADTMWQGTAPITASTTIAIAGLGVAQTSITGIQFRAIDGNSAYEGPSLSATACYDLAIDMYGGIAHIKANGVWSDALPWVNDNGEWKQAIPWVNDNGTWKIGV